MSDWDATYDAVAAANGGLDLEMPSGKFMNRATLLPASPTCCASSGSHDAASATPPTAVEGP